MVDANILCKQVPRRPDDCGDMRPYRITTDCVLTQFYVCLHLLS